MADALNLPDGLSIWESRDFTIPPLPPSITGSITPPQPVPKVSEDKCSNTGVTDEGIIKANNIKQAIKYAMLAYNIYNSYKLANLQQKIANAYLNLSKTARDYYNNRYKPLELENIKEATDEPLYVRDKDPMYRGQMIITARHGFIGQIEKNLRCTSRYCTGLRNALINDLLLKQATSEAMVSAMAHRYADKEELAFNNYRWEKRRGVLNLGRDIPTETIAYADLASGIFGSLGGQLANSAMGIASWLAYDKYRRPTEYNAPRSPLNPAEWSYEVPKYDKYLGINEFSYKKPPPPVETKPKVVNLRG